MALSLVAALIIATILLLLGGTIAFGQRAPHEGDAPPAYYRRMIVGVMVGATGLILAVFALSWAYWVAAI